MSVSLPSDDKLQGFPLKTDSAENSEKITNRQLPKIFGFLYLFDILLNNTNKQKNAGTRTPLFA